MPQSLARILIHTIFSTKHREPYLAHLDTQSELHAFMGGVAKELGCAPIRIGGTADHVHLLTTLSRTKTAAEFVKEVKRVSTNWARKRPEISDEFCWQAGYGMFSVSESAKDAVVAYIANQEEHHRKMSFQDEFRRFCSRYGVDYDEQYVWE